MRTTAFVHTRHCRRTPWRAERVSLVRCLLLTATLLSGVLSTSVASAYRTGADTSDFPGTTRVRWNGPITFRVHDQDVPNVTAGKLANVLQSAYITWQAPLCTSVEFRYSGLTDARAELGDGVNTVSFITEGWTERGYDPQGAAITETEYAAVEGGDWEIVEADIFLNAEHHGWEEILTQPVEGYRDVLSVLTHELGHALGLLHPCENPGRGSVPDCDDGDFDPQDTMYPEYDLAQQQLGADSKAGVCWLYPGEGCPDDGCADGYKCVRDDCVQTCGDDGVCQSDEVCFNSECITPAEVETKLAEPPGCESDDDCGKHAECAEGGCVSTLGGLGDPCEENADCQSEQCQDDVCVADKCRGDECEAASGSPRAATANKALGEECSEADECIANQCLEGAEPHPVCTRLCGPGQPVCPSNWSCETVKNRDVCVPDEEPEAGCAVHSVRPGQNLKERAAGWAWFISVLAFAAMRQRRRPRRSFK